MLIHHFTLATANRATHRLDTLAPHAIDACRALLPVGGIIPEVAPGWTVAVCETVFTVFFGVLPIVTCGIGEGADKTWESLCELQAKFAPVVVSTPPATRWLGVVLLPGIAQLSRDDFDWLADFERCMAAAMLRPASPIRRCEDAHPDPHDPRGHRGGRLAGLLDPRDARGAPLARTTGPRQLGPHVRPEVRPMEVAMGEGTKIEWANHSWSPWRGCTKVSPWCANCYAETLAKRNPAVLGGWEKD